MHGWVKKQKLRNSRKRLKSESFFYQNNQTCHSRENSFTYYLSLILSTVKRCVSHIKWAIRVSSFVGVGRGSPKKMRSRHQWDQEQLKQEHQSGRHDPPNPPLSPEMLLTSTCSIFIYEAGHSPAKSSGMHAMWENNKSCKLVWAGKHTCLKIYIL